MAKKKLFVGAHMSAAGGAYNALYRGKEIGCTAVQLFTSNQRQWQPKEISQEEVDLWFKARNETGLNQIMSHDSYLINLGSNNPQLLEKSREAFKKEIERCHLFDIPYLNFHPGAATTSSVEECLDMIIESLNSMKELTVKGTTRLLLETTAGQGTTVGHKFEHLCYILDHVDTAIPMGVCIDTCHIFSAGYDLRTKEAVQNTLQEFDDVVGLKRLFAFHLNDSLKEFGSKRDRHAPLGQGTIGLEAFQSIVQDERVNHLPMFLETPDPSLYKEEINLLQDYLVEALS